MSAEIVRALGDQGHHYARVESIPVSTLELNLSGAGLQSAGTTSNVAFRLTSDDGRSIVTLAPDAVTLETPRYGRWEGDFRERFLTTVAIASGFLQPAVSSRLGLRYVDVIKLNLGRPADLGGVIRQEFLGPLLNAPFFDAVRVMQQQMNLDLGDGLAAVLRHSLFYDINDVAPMRYLIDTDVFRETFSAFDMAEVHPLLNRMHDASASLFQYVITSEFYEELSRE